MRLFIVIATLLTASAAAAQSPAVIDAGQARDLGLVARQLTVPVAPGASAESAVSRFLDRAGRRGASFVGRLSWVWAESDPWGTIRCQAPLAVMVSEPWRIRVGRETCVPLGVGARVRAGIHGELYFRRSGPAMSRAQMRALAEQLEPPPPRRHVRRPIGRRRGWRAQRRAQRREIRALADQLE